MEVIYTYTLKWVSYDELWCRQYGSLKYCHSVAVAAVYSGGMDVFNDAKRKIGLFWLLKSLRKHLEGLQGGQKGIVVGEEVVWQSYLCLLLLHRHCIGVPWTNDSLWVEIEDGANGQAYHV